MRTIYEPKGRAREYSPLALNIYKDCPHGCRSCYVKKMPWYKSKPIAIRDGLLDELEKQAKKMYGDKRNILLCFSCDPYPVGYDTYATRESLLILEKYKLNVSVLTKGGTLACRDFDILRRNNWTFGTTITGLNPDRYEPFAADAYDRIVAIETAKAMKIKTMVSVEPVYHSIDALNAIKKLLPIVDFWKIGKLNYDKEIERRIDWDQFLDETINILGEDPDKVYYKKDLIKAAQKK